MDSHKLSNGEENLQLISRMINTAKADIEDNSFYYLIWGWLVFASCIIHFSMLKMSFHPAEIGWMILMPLGALLTIIYSIRQDKQVKIYTYIHDIMKYVLIAFMVSLLIVLAFMSKLGAITYPMVMLVYGIWLFVSGGALKFKPLIAGGIINWLLAIASLFVAFQQQLIILALAVLLGYIIPGHLLRMKYKKTKTVTD